MVHVHYYDEHVYCTFKSICTQLGVRELNVYVQILYKTELTIGSVLVMILSSRYTVLPLINTSWLMLFIYS